MAYTSDQLRLFVAESNLIENITREPRDSEVAAAERVLSLDQMTTPELCRYQWAIAPGHPLRVAQGMDVQVGGYIAPEGGPNIRARLDRIIDRANAWSMRGRAEISSEIEQRVGDRVGSPFEIHIRFELLHPFMDGPGVGANGRTGRMLWLWQMREQDFKRSFLHQFYYQTLASSQC